MIRAIITVFCYTTTYDTLTVSYRQDHSRYIVLPLRMLLGLFKPRAAGCSLAVSHEYGSPEIGLP